MNDAYVIEIGEEAVGLVVREEASTGHKRVFKFLLVFKRFRVS